MTDHAGIAGALPFYAAGTLDAAERREVETHLEGCAACRAALEEIRELAATGASASVASATAHVAPGLLVAYAEAPEALEPETRAFVEARLAGCATCREAHENLLRVQRAIEELPAERAPAPGVVPGAKPTLWERLAATFLRPAPALAYLLIAAVGLPLVWVLRAPGDPVASVRIVALQSDRSLRDAGVTAPAIEIAPGGRREALLLELETDLLAGDVAGARFDVELSRDGRPVWSETRDGGDFTIRGERAVLPLVLNARRLATGVDYRLAIRAVRPGDPLDGQALFARSLRFRSE